MISLIDQLPELPGEVWASECGNYVLVCADCLEVLPLLPEGVVDAVVTDPPYGIVNQFGEVNTFAGGRRNGKRKLQWSWDTQAVIDDVRRALSESFYAAKRSAACIVYCGFDTAERYAEPARRAGFTVKPLAWVKACPPPAGLGNWWPSGFELGYYGYRKSPWFGDSDPKRRNVWTCDSYRYGQPGKVDHPTQKPLRLIQPQVAAIVHPGGLALDPFMGSGTTGVACARLDRRFLGIEIDPKYFAIAKNRIQAELGRYPLFEEPKPTQRTLDEV